MDWIVVLVSGLGSGLAGALIASWISARTALRVVHRQHELREEAEAEAALWQARRDVFTHSGTLLFFASTYDTWAKQHWAARRGPRLAEMFRNGEPAFTGMTRAVQYLYAHESDREVIETADKVSDAVGNALGRVGTPQFSSATDNAGRAIRDLKALLRARNQLPPLEGPAEDR